MSFFAALVDFGPTAYLKLLFCWLEANYVVEQSSRSELPAARANGKAGFLDRPQRVRRTITVRRGFGCGLLLRTHPATPMRVRGILLAALAYFIFRSRYRPLTLLWRGLAFTDDAKCSAPCSGSPLTSSLSIARQQPVRSART